jgi:phage shock protein PspC (stress-responsive transcriptional regulator)
MKPIYSKNAFTTMNDWKLIRFMLIGLIIGVLASIPELFYIQQSNFRIMFVLSLPEFGLITGLLYGAIQVDRETQGSPK